MVFDLYGDVAVEMDVGLGEWKVFKVSWIRMKIKKVDVKSGWEISIKSEFRRCKAVLLPKSPESVWY